MKVFEVYIHDLQTRAFQSCDIQNFLKVFV